MLKLYYKSVFFMKTNFLSIAIGFIGSFMVQIVDSLNIDTPESVEGIVKIIVQLIIGFATIVSLFRKRSTEKKQKK